MRYSTPVAAIALVVVLAFTGGVPTSVAVGESREAKVYPRTYRIMDLPVYSLGGERFEPSFLMAYLKANVDPASWDGRSMMAPYPQNRALVISTTNENHEAIKKILDRFRGETAKDSDAGAADDGDASKTAAPPAVEFEDLQTSQGAVALKRAKIPGGWLVTTGTSRGDSGSGVTFVPDASHAWNGESLP